MADPWLAMEVLRELDDAGARYFALTLLSPTSRHYLEIPVHFTDETGWPFDEQCALVTSISTEKEWPLQVRRLSDVRGGISAMSVGGGWANFLADQNVGFGAMMTFEVVDERRLVVALHHRRTPEEAEETDNETGLVRDCRGGDLPEVSNTRPMTLTVLPEIRTDVRPQFRKTLRKTHVLKHASSRIDVPTHFWHTHGVELFDGISYTLHGPLRPWRVETHTHTYGKQTACSFTKGWAGFVTANDLQLGDKVIFTQLGPLEFAVRKV